MVASTRTKLDLATFARYMGMHPLHFNQVYLETDSHCDQLMMQHEWQNSDAVSREEIARVIAEAESKIENALGYHLAPAWEVDEWRGVTQPIGSWPRSYWKAPTVTANWGYMISGGREAKEVIEADASITYTDEDGDGYKETATVIVNTVVLDINEIALFYPGKSGDDGWEIRPIEVAIASGVATITFRRELAVIPELLEQMGADPDGANGLNDADFLTEVDVYRRYNDPQTQASFLWEPFATVCGCSGSGCSACAYQVQTGCFLVRGDPRLSILAYHPAEWNSEDHTFSYQSWAAYGVPDIVRLYYYSGWRNKGQRYVSRMDPQWERTVAYMAAGMLDRPPCSCVQGQWERWRQDLTLAQGSADGAVGLGFFRQPEGTLDNPFGTTRGEVNAWRQVRDKMLGSSADL